MSARRVTQNYVKQEKGINAEKVKASVAAEIEARRYELTELSLKLHDHPETALKEVKASGWLTEYLESNGFAIKKGICQLPTAFRATYGKGKPVIAILAEYDALPKLGHACGHNLIATSAVAAGVAAKKAVDQFGGTIAVTGTPGEELSGGKIFMVERGAFDGVDMAMMVHPDVTNTATTHFLACQTLDVEFFGRAAHAAGRPERGINALEAMILSFNAIDSLRQHIESTARIHGIITDGGEAANIVPAHSAGNFIVRAVEDSYLDELKDRVINCFTGAALATGARLEYKWGDVRYASLRNNMTLARLFRQNLQSLGRKVFLFDPNKGTGSSDIGNVSHVVPSIHPSIAIATGETLMHSPDFAIAAASDAGNKALLDGAKAMAMTVVDLLSNPAIVAEVKKEFLSGK